MSSILLLIVLSFTHAYDIETPSSGLTLSLLELSYSTRYVAIRTSPVVMPFMSPITLRLSSHNAFLKISFAPFYGGYFIKSSYPEITEFKAGPMFGIGLGMWLGEGSLKVIPGFDLYMQKNTIYTGRLAIKYDNLLISSSLGNKGTSGIEGMYILKSGKFFMILGIRYPGFYDMGLYLPLVPLFNAGFTF